MALTPRSGAPPPGQTSSDSATAFRFGAPGTTPAFGGDSPAQGTASGTSTSGGISGTSLPGTGGVSTTSGSTASPASSPFGALTSSSPLLPLGSATTFSLFSSLANAITPAASAPPVEGQDGSDLAASSGLSFVGTPNTTGPTSSSSLCSASPLFGSTPTSASPLSIGTFAATASTPSLTASPVAGAAQSWPAISGASSPTSASAASLATGPPFAFGTVSAPLTSTTPAAGTSSLASSFGVVGATASGSSSAVASSSAFGTMAAAAPSAAPLSQPIKPPSEIKGKTVEEIIREWSYELEARCAAFRQQAEALQEWDQRIRTNRSALVALQRDVGIVTETRNGLEKQLDLIDIHQQEVDVCLQRMEQEAEKLFQDEQERLVDDDAATTRDMMYEQAQLVEEELEKVSNKIRDAISLVNAPQGGESATSEGSSPLEAVHLILNNQLTTLMCVVEKAADLENRLQNLSEQNTGFNQQASRSLWGA